MRLTGLELGGLAGALPTPPRVFAADPTRGALVETAQEVDPRGAGDDARRRAGRSNGATALWRPPSRIFYVGFRPFETSSGGAVKVFYNFEVHFWLTRLPLNLIASTSPCNLALRPPDTVPAGLLHAHVGAVGARRRGQGRAQDPRRPPRHRHRPGRCPGRRRFKAAASSGGGTRWRRGRLLGPGKAHDGAPNPRRVDPRRVDPRHPGRHRLRRAHRLPKERGKKTIKVEVVHCVQ